MEFKSVPPDEPSAAADGSPKTGSEEHEHYGSDFGNQNTFRSRKRTKFGRYISDITLEEVQQYTNCPAHVACERLGLGLTSFKRLCRNLGITAWPYKKDLSLPSSAYASEYASAPYNHMHSNYAWNRQPDPAGAYAARPVMPRPVSFSAFPQMRTHAAQFTYSPPRLPQAGQGHGSLLQNLCSEATPMSLAQLMGQIKDFSDEMRDMLGISIINDEAVDLIVSACGAIEAASQLPPPPSSLPAESNPAAALMAILAQVRGSLQR